MSHSLYTHIYRFIKVCQHQQLQKPLQLLKPVLEARRLLKAHGVNHLADVRRQMHWIILIRHL